MENRISSFRKNGVHFEFGDIGISMIWGWGSYCNNYDNVQYTNEKGDRDIKTYSMDNDIQELDGVYCQNVEIYPLGEWSKKLRTKILKHFKSDDFPIGYVDVSEIPYVLNTVKRLSKLKK